MTYHNIAKDSDINVDERDFGVATNLYIVPLHFLKVSERGFVKKHTEDDNNYHILRGVEITNCQTFWPIFNTVTHILCIQLSFNLSDIH